MAVPKKRTGASAQGHRRSNWKATKPATSTCSNCGAITLAHTVCTECGYYKGKPASIKHDDYTAETIENKPAKKSSKKAEVVAEEVKEVKAEETVETEAVTEETSEEKDAE